MHHHKYPLDNKYLLLGWKTAINRKLFQELGLTRLVKNFSLLQEWSRAESVSHVLCQCQSSMSQNCDIAQVTG